MRRTKSRTARRGWRLLRVGERPCSSPPACEPGTVSGLLLAVSERLLSQPEHSSTSLPRGGAEVQMHRSGPWRTRAAQWSEPLGTPVGRVHQCNGGSQRSRGESWLNRRLCKALDAHANGRTKHRRRAPKGSSKINIRAPPNSMCVHTHICRCCA